MKHPKYCTLHILGIPMQKASCDVTGVPRWLLNVCNLYQGPLVLSHLSMLPFLALLDSYEQSSTSMLRTMCNLWYCNMMAEQCLNFCVKGTRYISRILVVCRCLKKYPDVYNKALWSCSNPFFFFFFWIPMSCKHCLHNSRQSVSKIKQFFFLADMLTFSLLHSHLFSLSLSVFFSCEGYSNRGSTNWFFLENATYYLCCEFLPSRVTSFNWDNQIAFSKQVWASSVASPTITNAGELFLRGQYMKGQHNTYHIHKSKPTPKSCDLCIL